MMKLEEDQLDADLDSFFQAARAEPAFPSAVFMDRLVADALDQQSESPSLQPSPLQTMGQAIGGWFGGFGLATAMALGLMLGVSFDGLATTPLGGTDVALEEFVWLEDFAELTWEEF